jgi:hypothetical protein
MFPVLRGTESEADGENWRQRAFFLRATLVIIFSATRRAGSRNISEYIAFYFLGNQ